MPGSSSYNCRAASALGLQASEGILNNNSVEDYTNNAFKSIALLKEGDQVLKKEDENLSGKRLVSRKKEENLRKKGKKEAETFLPI